MVNVYIYNLGCVLFMGIGGDRCNVVIVCIITWFVLQIVSVRFKVCIIITMQRTILHVPPLVWMENSQTIRGLTQCKVGLDNDSLIEIHNNTFKIYNLLFCTSRWTIIRSWQCGGNFLCMLNGYCSLNT